MFLCNLKFNHTLVIIKGFNAIHTPIRTEAAAIIAAHTSAKKSSDKINSHNKHLDQGSMLTVFFQGALLCPSLKKKNVYYRQKWNPTGESGTPADISPIESGRSFIHRIRQIVHP